MSRKISGLSRRDFLRRTGAVAGMSAVGMSLGARAFASDSFPSQTMQILIPTGEGGGVDRTARAFNSVWQKHLGANFEYSYFPGAGGQVGYETFLGRWDADGHHLLFGNIGPEMIMYATQDTNYTYPDDYTYFAGVDADDAVLWVANDSPFGSIQDLVDAGQERQINISTSRLPHPSSLGVLALADATGANFQLIPYGGGSAARSAAVTGEVDACATFMSSSLSLADQIRFLTVFNDHNRMPGETEEAPTVNEVFDTNIPVLTGNRAFAIQQSAIDEYPERYEALKNSIRESFDDPKLVDAFAKSGKPAEFVEYSDSEKCNALAASFHELASKYADMLKG
ncbi:MAG: tripartite tricarboxylate transporter substrate-binding protein [Halofilum sp. (in: g-proteobacteria)]